MQGRDGRQEKKVLKTPKPYLFGLHLLDVSTLSGNYLLSAISLSHPEIFLW
jgi:hypothetical protein